MCRKLWVLKKVEVLLCFWLRRNIVEGPLKSHIEDKEGFVFEIKSLN